jgi:hypothetical protein
MTSSQKILLAGIVSSLLSLVFHPEHVSTSIALIAFCVLFGFDQYLNRKRSDDTDKLREEIKILKDKVESLQIGKSFGR